MARSVALRVNARAIICGKSVSQMMRLFVCLCFTQKLCVKFKITNSNIENVKRSAVRVPRSPNKSFNCCLAVMINKIMNNLYL